jgi:hypothetical protein
MDGACSLLISPAADAECFQILLDSLAKRFCRQHILLILDGTANHTTDDLYGATKFTIPAHQWPHKAANDYSLRESISITRSETEAVNYACMRTPIRSAARMMCNCMR